MRLEPLITGIAQGQRAALSRAITLIESQAPRHRPQALELLKALPPPAKPTLRLGISGLPGAGKSTFIEALGMHLIEQGHRVAVLAIDPSSVMTGGSILGDKTRMEQLSNAPEAFVRPTASGGVLGGVSARTHDVVTLCEAAGYDLVIVETVGVGQSEITVRYVVDFFTLLLLPATGDDLQGIKKGGVELADAIVVNKKDLFPKAARQTRLDYQSGRHFQQDGQVFVQAISAHDPQDIQEFWKKTQARVQSLKDTGEFETQRLKQGKYWIEEELKTQVWEKFRQDNQEKWDTLEETLHKKGVYETVSWFLKPD